MPKRKKIAVVSLLLASLFMCSGCSDTSQPLSDTVIGITSTVSATTTVSELVQSPVESESPTSTTTSSSVMSDEITVSSSAPIESMPPVITSTEDFPTEEPPAEQTTASSSVTSTATTTAVLQEDAVEDPPDPAVPIVVPDVYMVSASGKRVESCDRAVIDYSNADKGYIGVSYSGSSDRAKLRIMCNDETYDHDIDIGGDMQFFPLSQGSGDYHIQVYEHLDGKNYGFVIELKTSIAIIDEVDMYLYPNKYVEFVKSSECVYKAAEVCAGVDSEIARFAEIFKYVTENITYDNELAATVKSGYVPYPDTTLAKGKGICFDYASLVAAMARSQGIPTRLVIGYASDNIYHAWNEIYTEETGWISAELLLSQNGFNIVDATFYSGAADKEAIAQYISDSGNYAAVFRY